MAVTVGVHHAVGCVVRVEFEVVFPARGHPVVVVVLVVDLRAVVPFVTVGVVGDRVRSVLELFEIRVVLQVVVEANTVGGVGVDVTLAVGRILIARTVFLDQTAAVQSVTVRVFLSIGNSVKVTVFHRGVHHATSA